MSFQLTDCLICLLIAVAVFVIFLYAMKWMVPLYFRYSYSKGFDGSYEPKEDFLELNDTLPRQNNTPDVIMTTSTSDDSIKPYQIHFGRGRSFTAGLIKIFYRGSWYSSNHSEENSKPLELIGLRKNPVSDIFPQKKWESTLIEITWKIPETELEVVTGCYVFEDQGFLIFESKLNGDFTDLNPDHIPIGPINIIFPSFRNDSNNKRIFTFRDGVFCPPRRDLHFSHAPVLLFDDQTNCVLISALDHFLTSGVTKKEEGNSYRISCGSNASIADYPSDYEHRYIMVFDFGINHTFKRWGDLLHEYYDKPRRGRYEDVLTSYLGYFTDNGAHYYYNPESGMKMDETLIAVEKDAKNQGIPYQYFHLDSWWYQKVQPKWKKVFLSPLKTILGAWLYGGAVVWERDIDFIEMKISELSEKLNGKPFSAHGRWFIQETPYKENFNFIIQNEWAMPFDRKFWEHIMRYCKENRIEIYEQDWMVNQLRHFSFLQSEIGTAKKWLDDMAETAAEQDITIQYCMETPGMLMNAIHHPNITHCRTCDDYGGFKPHNYDVPFFTQSSMLAWALGLCPFKDVFWSSKRGLWKGERKPYLMALLSCLSTGPVGPGDEIGHADKNVLLPACRSDGLLLKPDRPITACDVVYVKNNKYYFASTESTLDGYKWYYLLTINLWNHRVEDRTFRLDELDIQGQFIEYNWFTHETRRVESKSINSANLGFEEYNYCVYAPIFENGCAFFGDISKYSCVNDKEISKLDVTNNKIMVEINGVDGDDVSLLFYIETEPEKVEVEGKKVHGFAFNENTKQFLVTLSFKEDCTKKVTISL